MHHQLNAIHITAMVATRSYSSIARLSLLTAGLLLLISACSSTQPYGRAVKVESRTVHTEPVIEDPAQRDTSTPFDERQINTEQAEYYEQIARQESAQSGNQPARSDAILSAAEHHIQAGNFTQSEALIRELEANNLEAVERDRYDVILAYVDYSRQQYRVALNRLNQLRFRFEKAINTQPIGSTQIVDALLLSSFCHQQLGEHGAAIDDLIQREQLLNGSAKAETTRYIWQVIDALNADQRTGILLTSPSDAVRNRLEQSQQGQIGQQQEAPNEFDQWRDASEQSIQRGVQTEWNEQSARNIAVILPLSSKFSKAAKAVADGIKYQHSLNHSPFRPTLSIYDVGDFPSQIAQHYAGALTNGADFVIGPLGKEYSDQLAPYARQAGQVPTLLLGGDSVLGGNLTRLTMSPEWDGVMVARRALAQGRVTAALLVPDNQAGQRTAEAFQQEWFNSGGRISNVINYSPAQFDHSTELKQLFNIGQSEYRHTKLSNTLGFKPEFSVYQRADIDFIFMIADTKAGRLLRPQINFFSGSRVPVYAGSSVFNGIQDRTNNVDLDQTQFPVMPWMLRSADIAPYAGQLNMLFAMGADAYQVAASFERMKRNFDYAIDGNMGALSLDSQGEIRYQPVWASFNNGIAETATELKLIEGDARGSLNTNRPAGSGQNGNGENSYDDSNWDPGQARRKAGL